MESLLKMNVITVVDFVEVTKKNVVEKASSELTISL
jgi:hypothetical protein